MNIVNGSVQGASVDIDIPLTQVLYVDKAGNDSTGTGNIDEPYLTIQKALDMIPAATSSTEMRRVYVIKVMPGTYDEELSIDIGRKKVVILPEGIVNVGTFGGSNWAVSGTARNMNVTCSLANIDSIRSSLSIIAPISAANYGTHQLYGHAFRLSGTLNVSNTTGGSSGELDLKGVSILGWDGVAVGNNASIAAGSWAGNLNMYMNTCRMYGAITGGVLRLQHAINCSFEKAIAVATYSMIRESEIKAGMTWTVAPTEVPPCGILDCVLTGAFTGNTNIDLLMNKVTNYHFLLNSCTLGANTKKVLLDLEDEETYKQITTPGNPSAGYNKVYFKNDNKLYQLTSGGVETEVGGSGAVASVNTQTGAVVLTSADINGTDPTDSSVDTQDNINANLFQYANNGKTGIANAIGAAEASSSDTFTVLAGYVTTDKGTMATNLTAKGVTAAGTETLAALASKIGNIVLGDVLDGVTESATLLSNVVANDLLIGSHLIKQANPADLPGVTGKGVAHITFGGTEYMAVASAGTPYVQSYTWNGTAWVVIADPGTLPAGAAYGVAFYEFSSALYMAVAHATTPFVTIYKLTTGAWVKMNNPATLPTGTGNGVSFIESESSLYCAVAHDTSPYVSIYKLSGTTWSKMSNPATLPTGVGYGVAFHHISGTHYLAVSHNTSPYVSTYTRSTTTWTKQTDPTNLPTGVGYGVSFCDISNTPYMAVAHGGSPYVTIYQWSGSEFVKQSNPLILPNASNAYSVNVKQLGTDYYMSVGHAGGTFLTVYKLVGGAWFNWGQVDTVTTAVWGVVNATIGGANYIMTSCNSTPYFNMYKLAAVAAKQSTTVSIPLQANTFLAYATTSGSTNDVITIKTLRY